MSTCKKIIEECIELGAKPPTGLKKDELVAFKENLVYAIEKGLSLETASDYKMPFKEFKALLVPKYRDESMDWIDHLEEYGWTTVKVPDLDVDEAIDAFYTTLETCRYKGSEELTMFRRDKPETWNDLPPNLHGIFKSNFGHLQFLWNIRERCIDVFKEICQEEELLVSFDGGCFIPPGKGMSGSWFHCDQGRLISRDYCCAQGVVALTPSGPHDGGLVVIEGSHKIFGDYLDTHPVFGFAWAKVDVSDPLVRDLSIVKVCVPAGHIMLFDSRTFHCNMPPEPEAKTPRMVTYVSMLGKSGATPKELSKRKEAFKKQRMTNHWAYTSALVTTAKDPRSWGKDYLVPVQKAPVLNEVQKALIA